MAAITLDMITPEIEARFWAKVDRREPHRCWPWLSAVDWDGYGVLWAYRRNHKATHIALELAGEPRQGGLWALHSCDNPSCVNPKHLRWGTNVANVADKVARRRQLAGTRNSSAKLTDEQVIAIRADARSQTTIAASYGMSQPQISAIQRRASWGHI